MPAPTIGGHHLTYDSPSGVQDQRPLLARDDVLSYTSAALVTPITVCGSVWLRLWCRSSAPTTDFVATLLDIRTDGVVENVADGIRRLPLGAAGEIREAVIDLWDVAYTFETGHRIGLLITSSSFPRYDRKHAE